MKKIISCAFVFLVLSTMTPAFAQIRVGVKGGLNSSSLSNYNKVFVNGSLSENIDFKISNNKKPGFNIGIFAQIDIPFTDFLIQPEILFSNQGSKVKERYKTEVGGMDFTNKDDHTLTLNHLHIPVYGAFKLDMGIVDFIFGVGPYVSYGLWGSDDVYDNKELKRFDAGATIMAGVELSRFQITAGYDHGLINLGEKKIWEDKKSSSLYNRNLKISVGYFF